MQGFAKYSALGILGRSQTGIAMNAYRDLSMKSDEVLRFELEEFRRQHHDLDQAINALEEKATGDPFSIKRLKQQKLRLKDIIAQIEDRLYPDIIA